MRDIEHLDDFYKTLKDIQVEYCPDWRFGQLFCNLQSYAGNDLFYYEEDKLIALIKECFHIDN